MYSIRVIDAVPIENLRVLVIFENRELKIFDVKKLFKEYPEYEALKDLSLFNSLEVEPGGYGISWNSELDCSEGELWEDGETVNLNLDDIIDFLKYGLLNSKEVTNLLGCSRQYVNEMSKKGLVHPVKSSSKETLFLKSEIREKKLFKRQSALDNKKC